MTKNNNRFANRETVIKGFVIDLANQTQTPFEVKTAYTRSNDKAVTFAREALEIDDNPQIIVAVTEIQNEAPKPIKYNDGKIYDLAYNRFDSENEAIEAANLDGSEVRAINWYEISAQIWAFDSDGNYITEWYANETPANLTKQNARDFMKMSYEDFSGSKVLGIHACEKKEKPMYCVITSENLARCIDK